MLKSNSWKPTGLQELHPRETEKVENHSHSKTQDSTSWGWRIEPEGNGARNKDCRSSYLGRKHCARKKISLRLGGSSAGHELPAGKAQGFPWELTLLWTSSELLELTLQVIFQLQRGSGRSCRNCWTERRFKSVQEQIGREGRDSVWKTCEDRDEFQQQKALASHRIKSLRRSH